MRVLFLLIIMTLLIFQSGCDGDMNCANNKNSHCCITLINNSNIRLHCIRAPYAGTQVEWQKSKDSTATVLNIGQSIDLRAGGAPHTCWESTLKNRQQLWYYFFNADTLEALAGDSSVITGRGLLETRQIDLTYLQRNGFKITYP